MKRIMLAMMLICSVAYANDDTYRTITSTGRQTVTTNGTRVQLTSDDVPCTRVIVTAETDNTNPVTVGNASVVGALATRKGIPLSAGQSITLRIDNLNKVWIDSVTDTEGVTWIAYL